MERAKVVKDEIIEQNVRFLAVYLETRNACLVLLSENEDRLGTLAVAIPKPADSPGLPSSTILLGDRNVVSARMFAEYLASKKGKIVLVSIYLESINELQAQSIFKKLLERAMPSAAEPETGGSLL
ncbi:MAG: proteasome assembly chaperone 4 family protein [Candidatus Bathyarchaeia archaeon]